MFKFDLAVFFTCVQHRLIFWAVIELKHATASPRIHVNLWQMSLCPSIIRSFYRSKKVIVKPWIHELVRSQVLVSERFLLFDVSFWLGYV